MINSYFEPDVNSTQLRPEVDSISNIIFKSIVSPAGSVNGTYFQYLVNQSQVEAGVPLASQIKGKTEIDFCHI